MLLAGVLAASLLGPCATPACAWADDVSAAQTALSDAESRMGQIKAEYAALESEIGSLQVQIDDATQGVMETQAAMQDGRVRLGSMCVQDYKLGSVSLLDVLFNSESLGDLLSNIHCLGVLQQAQADEIEAQKQREAAFNEALGSMNAKKDAQMQALGQAAQKTAEAEAVVANAAAQLKNAQDAAEEQRLAALKAEAEKLADSHKSNTSDSSPEVTPQPGQGEGESGNQGGQGGNQGSSGESGGNAGGNNEAAGGNGGSGNGGTSGGSDASAGWKSGVASAYGSKTDGTLGATTATGATVTESSMGVAVPMSWPNYRSYFGRTVEISYGGMTVFAVVNDCGGMGGGSRSLDLQPGVWRALGASSCFDWGLRTVSYRFL